MSNPLTGELEKEGEKIQHHRGQAITADCPLLERLASVQTCAAIVLIRRAANFEHGRIVVKQ